MERLAREKIATQQRLAELKHELSQWMDVLEIDRVLRQTGQPEDDQASTSTASGEPRPLCSSCHSQMFFWASLNRFFPARKEATCPSPDVFPDSQAPVCLQPIVFQPLLT
jgi:hypothetical protein